MRKIAVLLLTLSGCAGIKPPVYNVITFIGAKSYCSSFSESRKKDLLPIMEFASRINDEQLLNEMVDPTGVMSIFSGWYRSVWVSVGNKLEGRVENADEWLATAKQLIRTSVEGCYAGLRES